MIHTCSGKTFVAGKNNITEWYCLYLPRSWFYYLCTRKDLFSHQLEGWCSWGLFWTLTAHAYLPHRLLTRLIPYWQLHSQRIHQPLGRLGGCWGYWENGSKLPRVAVWATLLLSLWEWGNSCPQRKSEKFDDPISFHRLLVNTLSGELTISMIVINQSTWLNQT